MEQTQEAGGSQEEMEVDGGQTEEEESGTWAPEENQRRQGGIHLVLPRS